ncbi:MAG: hypothetical protein M3P22_01370 [bacterium]|nr:hypothetical protein [bacterium]
MRNATFKLNSYVANIDVIDNSNLEKKFFHSMIFVLGLLGIGYFFIVANITVNVIERKNLLEEEHLLSNELGDLELKYLAISSKVDLNLAYKMGFQETKATFATRISTTPLSSLHFAKENLAQNTNSIKLAKNEF